MFELPSRTDIVKCVVTKEVVAEDFKPTLLTSSSQVTRSDKVDTEEEETA
jgi:ATP-dependent protease Clp ATPase subunit